MCWYRLPPAARCGNGCFNINNSLENFGKFYWLGTPLCKLYLLVILVNEYYFSYYGGVILVDFIFTNYLLRWKVAILLSFTVLLLSWNSFSLLVGFLGVKKTVILCHYLDRYPTLYHLLYLNRSWFSLALYCIQLFLTLWYHFTFII